MIRVSVIVPVLNPGEAIAELIDSLCSQTLPADRFEVIFVDDGSTDGTAARLDALVAQRPNMQVHHQRNSGWPGQPRNLGTDRATGDYVFYADNDDWLAHDALERLVLRADADRADVVVGKVVGHGRAVSRPLFERDRSDVTMTWPPLLQLLTPHKLFRRSFLDGHGIRFPEGRRRLEDHHFVVRAYFAAPRVTVLANRPCYHWVARAGGSASRSPLDPAHYFAGLGAVLELVETRAASDEERHLLLAHWYRSKVLRQLHGRRMAARTPERNAEVFEAVRVLALDRFPQEVAQHLSPADRARSWLVRRGDLQGMLALAAFDAQLRARVRPLRLATPRLRVEGRLRGRGGVRLRAVEAGWEWLPPTELRQSLDGADLRTTDPVELQVVARDDGSGVEYPLPAMTAFGAGEGAAALTADVSVDAAIAGAGRPLTGGPWTVRFNVRIGGFMTADARRVTIVEPDGSTRGRGRLRLALSGDGGPAGLALEPRPAALGGARVPTSQESASC